MKCRKKFGCRQNEQFLSKKKIKRKKTAPQNVHERFLSHKILSVAHNAQAHWLCASSLLLLLVLLLLFFLAQHAFVTKILSRLLFDQQQVDSQRTNACIIWCCSSVFNCTEGSEFSMCVCVTSNLWVHFFLSFLFLLRFWAFSFLAAHCINARIIV